MAGVTYRTLGTPVTGHGTIGWTIILMLPISQDNYLRNSALICLAICIMASVLFFLLILYLTKSLFHMSEELEKVISISIYQAESTEGLQVGVGSESTI